MVLLELVPGRKGDGDTLVLVTANREVLSFAEWLFIGKAYLDSEASYYPVVEGNRGPCMLLEALLELAFGIDFEVVIERYGLGMKERLRVVDRRKHEGTNPPEFLHDF